MDDAAPHRRGAARRRPMRQRLRPPNGRRLRTGSTPVFCSASVSATCSAKRSGCAISVRSISRLEVLGEQHRDQRPAGDRHEQPVRTVERQAEIRLVLVGGAAHAGPLRAVAGVNEHRRLRGGERLAEDGALVLFACGDGCSASPTSSAACRGRSRRGTAGAGAGARRRWRRARRHRRAASASALRAASSLSAAWLAALMTIGAARCVSGFWTRRLAVFHHHVRVGAAEAERVDADRAAACRCGQAASPRTRP